LIDRLIKVLVLSLGGLLIFLVGHLLATGGEDARRPDPAPASGAAPRTEPEPGKLDANPSDIPTKRVKTIPVRPEDLAAGSSRP
jgi:hypothetical protein